jgi:DNA-binding response OmpR family regulator
MGQKLLIVDDEAHIRMLIEQTLEDLEDEGVELLFAENGEEALDLIQSERPSLVFLDVMMPKMNGMEVCYKVKKELALPDIYIILLTAKGQEVDRQKGLEMGADRYMTKPFDPSEMLSVAEEVLNLSN